MQSFAIYDTHGFIKRLKAVGFTEEQSEVFANEQTKLIENHLATKRDIEELRVDLKRDIEELRVDFKRDMKELEYRMTIKLGTMMVVAVISVATLVKLL